MTKDWVSLSTPDNLTYLIILSHDRKVKQAKNYVIYFYWNMIYDLKNYIACLRYFCSITFLVYDQVKQQLRYTLLTEGYTVNAE